MMMERDNVEWCFNLTPNDVEILDAENLKRMILGYAILKFWSLVRSPVSL